MRLQPLNLAGDDCICIFAQAIPCHKSLVACWSNGRKRTGTSIDLHMCTLSTPKSPGDTRTNAITVVVDSDAVLVYQPKGYPTSFWRQIPLEVEASDDAELGIGHSLLHLCNVQHELIPSFIAKVVPVG